MPNPLSEHPEQLLQSMDPSQFKMELGAYRTVENYVRKLIEDYDSQALPALKGLRLMGSLIRLPETIVQPAKVPMNEQFFFIGGVLGLRVMELERGSDFARQLYGDEDTIPVDLESIRQLPSRDQRMRTASHSIMNACDTGYHLAKPYHETVDWLSSKLCPEIVDQPYVRRGFGLTMLMTGQSIERKLRDADLLMMKAEVDVAAEIEWDTGWDELREGA